MKKGVSISLVISVMFLVVLIPIVNAGMFDWFKDFFNGDSLEGELRSGGGGCSTDADCGVGSVCDVLANFCTIPHPVEGYCGDGICDSTIGEDLNCHNDCCFSDGECGTGLVCMNGVCVEIPECTLDSECNDNDICTTDSCSGGSCVNVPIPSCNNPCLGLDCNDNDDCTTDSCVNGGCVNTAISPAPAGCGTGCTPPDCNDNDACTNDLCVNGNCQNTQMNCDDENDCTYDSCDNGVCDNELSLDCNPCEWLNCDDGDSCTEDSCESGICVNENIVCLEEDDDPCTTAVCVEGECETLEPDCSLCQEEEGDDDLFMQDLDGDGISDWNDNDDDGDGILDSEDPDSKQLSITSKNQESLKKIEEAFKECITLKNPEELCEKLKQDSLEEYKNKKDQEKEEPKNLIEKITNTITTFFSKLLKSPETKDEPIFGTPSKTSILLCSSICCSTEPNPCVKDENGNCIGCPKNNLNYIFEPCGPPEKGVCCKTNIKDPLTGSKEFCVGTYVDNGDENKPNEMEWSCQNEPTYCGEGYFECGTYSDLSPNAGDKICCLASAQDSCVENVGCCSNGQVPGLTGCEDCPEGTFDCSYQENHLCCFSGQICSIEAVLETVGIADPSPGPILDYFPICKDPYFCEDGKVECYKDSTGQKLCCGIEEICSVNEEEGIFQCCPPDNPPFGSPPSGCGMNQCTQPCGMIDSGLCCDSSGPNPTICTYDSFTKEYFCKEEEEEEKCPGDQNYCGADNVDGSAICCGPKDSCVNIPLSNPLEEPMGICCPQTLSPGSNICQNCPEGTSECGEECCSEEEDYHCYQNKAPYDDPNDNPQYCSKQNPEPCAVDGVVPEGVFYCGKDYNTEGFPPICCDTNNPEEDTCYNEEACI